jgi:purine catabolism regulator
MELTVESLIGELGLSLVSGREAADTHVRWVHSTELPDPTPWLKGGELLLTTGIQLDRAKVQRELIERLADHQIAGLGFGTGFAHKRLPAALVDEARKREFPLFEVPYELPFIAITERAFAQLVNERYEILQRNMAGDVLAMFLCSIS